MYPHLKKQNQKKRKEWNEQTTWKTFQLLHNGRFPSIVQTKHQNTKLLLLEFYFTNNRKHNTKVCTILNSCNVASSCMKLKLESFWKVTFILCSIRSLKYYKKAVTNIMTCSEYIYERHVVKNECWDAFFAYYLIVSEILESGNSNWLKLLS